MSYKIKSLLKPEIRKRNIQVWFFQLFCHANLSARRFSTIKNMKRDIGNLKDKRNKVFWILNCVLVISMCVAQLAFLPFSLIIQKKELVICTIENVKKEKNKLTKSKYESKMSCSLVLIFLPCPLLISQKNYNNQNYGHCHALLSKEIYFQKRERIRKVNWDQVTNNKIQEKMIKSSAA